MEIKEHGEINTIMTNHDRTIRGDLTGSEFGLHPRAFRKELPLLLVGGNSSSIYWWQPKARTIPI